VPISVQQLAERIDPERTVLFLGAGSSIPSRAPTSAAVSAHLAQYFSLAQTGYTLSELASLAERKTSRRSLIEALRTLFQSLKPTGGLLNMPLYGWKSLFTTNYDDLIEQTYERRGISLNVYSSNFDFTARENSTAVKLFKIHGTIGKDVSSGDKSRIIITESDYDQTTDYRDFLYDRLKSDLAGSQLVIIGHSLADPDIREIVNRAVSLNAKIENGGQIFLLLYSQDDGRATLFESRGIIVCFAGIDEFFAALVDKKHGATPKLFNDALDVFPALRPVTMDVEHASDPRKSDFPAMFNGWPATHADVLDGLTFERTVAQEIAEHLQNESILSATLLGASGVGKTTAARQAVQILRRKGFICWEHKTDLTLLASEWVKVAASLREESKNAVLIVDDAHGHLFEINSLADRLAAEKNFNLRLLLVATRHQWNPRIKSGNLYRFGAEFKLVQLSPEEIERLLQLIETNIKVRPLIDSMFSGFSRQERRRRLTRRCEADMFVCLKNIFASESFDDIMLREYADLEDKYQDIYRYVAAMENAGVHVHRQLVIRILKIQASSITACLDNLTDIISEYVVDEKEGVYGWKTRHSVIASIIARYKFSETAKRIDLFELVIDNLRPTYEIEIRTIRELCNVDTGIPSIPNKETQNRLLRKMMSIAPGERVPRHRLIRNLIEIGAYEKADTEIRVFEGDFSLDGPAYRYKVDLHVARALNSPRILKEDRIEILEQGRQIALTGIARFQHNKAILSAYAELGLEYYKLTNRYDYFDDATSKLAKAEVELGDPDISRILSRLNRRVTGKVSEEADEAI